MQIQIVIILKTYIIEQLAELTFFVIYILQIYICFLHYMAIKITNLFYSIVFNSVYLLENNSYLVLVIF